jgi:hypothetical protein
MVLSHWWTRHVESRKRGFSQVKSRDLFLFLRPMQYHGYALRIEWPKPLSLSGTQIDRRALRSQRTGRILV